MSPSSIRDEAADADVPATTTDAFLGGKVTVRQPARGHRSGFDAVVLAASLPGTTRGTIADFGAGVGVAGLCAAARLGDVDLVFVERDEAALVLLHDNLAANAPLCRSMRIIAADIGATGRERVAAGLTAGLADHVIMNPPFHPASRSRHSPDRTRAAAHMLEDGGLDRWIRAAASVLRPDGTVTVIWRADEVADLVAALSRSFGSIDLLPLHARDGAPAHRLLARAKLQSRAPLALLQGLVVHNADGSYREAVDAVLRHGAALAIPWRT
ncbi:protein-(glutamine-N5) methyltransferase, release factor-specific [Hartmannibacter diazotrophicus]|uniref:Protein-(Glutamine-N5) methyltransferase, release factor-specific n=1 Tax=Hartmannibacter diazotrophicus TaxID=1482074 RepID=A0A2C9D5B9_9HYPH|nr:methyltransferase [Hartmannibacter diazotrophicus]SON54705.1 protein-(glutamine-N5) methyltransferase, release factor-specific [Hartmannibacter diazotrophicus]